MPFFDAVERKLAVKASVRIDAGFPKENLLRGLEMRGTNYVCRIKNNPVLDRMAEPHLRRPVGRSPAEPRARTLDAVEHRLTLAVQSGFRCYVDSRNSQWALSKKPGAVQSEAPLRHELKFNAL